MLLKQKLALGVAGGAVLGGFAAYHYGASIGEWPFALFFSGFGGFVVAGLLILLALLPGAIKRAATEVVSAMRGNWFYATWLQAAVGWFSIALLVGTYAFMGMDPRASKAALNLWQWASGNLHDLQALASIAAWEVHVMPLFSACAGTFIPMLRWCLIIGASVGLLGTLDEILEPQNGKVAYHEPWSKIVGGVFETLGVGIMFSPPIFPLTVLGILLVELWWAVRGTGRLVRWIFSPAKPTTTAS